MLPLEYRALVVDDEPVIRQLAMLALTREGFSCDAASDGNEAKIMVERGGYDLVVTDLCMPQRNGHALTVDLLALEKRPMIVILTGVVEPRLVKDLILRGVDDLVFKPVDFNVFAAKMRGFVHRRKTQNPCRDEAPSSVCQAVSQPPGESETGADPTRDTLKAVNMANLERKLGLVPSILPISQTALEVFNMAGANSSSAKQLAAAIERDPSLTAELLRMANSNFYNPSGKKIVELEKAVTRLGQKRIGELALATNARAALSAEMLTWMDVGLAWKRSVAAGAAIERLVTQGAHKSIEEGLLLSTIMHGLGRVVLGTMYPKYYGRMTQICLEENTSLLEQEKRLFPENHAQVMARLLAIWNVPKHVCQPLNFILDDYASLARLPENLQMRVELIKLAVLVGQIAAGNWEAWDLLEFPPPCVLKRLRIPNIESLIDQTQADLEEVVAIQSSSGAVQQMIQGSARSKPLTHTVAYTDLGAGSFDFLPRILKSMGMEASGDDSCGDPTQQKVLVNGLGVPLDELATRLETALKGSPRIVVLDGPLDERCQIEGQRVSAPMSYSVLHRMSLEAARPLSSKAEMGRAVAAR